MQDRVRKPDPSQCYLKEVQFEQKGANKFKEEGKRYTMLTLMNKKLQWLYYTSGTLPRIRKSIYHDKIIN